MSDIPTEKVTLKEAAIAAKAFAKLALSEGKNRAREAGHKRATSVLPAAAKFANNGLLEIATRDSEKIKNTLESVGIKHE